MDKAATKPFDPGFQMGRFQISQQLKKAGAILACLLCLVPFSQSPLAGAEGEELSQLRQRYEEARAHFAKTQDYGKAYRESNEAAQQLLSALLGHWVALPEGSADEPDVRKEIKSVFKELAGSPLTEKHNIEKSFIARTVWLLLAEKKPTKGKAAFLAELTKPQFGVRMYDKLARRGQPGEPLGWHVQAAHALALLRSGKEQQAREEISILHKKVSINHTANPKGRLDYGSEAGDARFRSYTDYLQICEALLALQAANSNDCDAAKKHIGNAKKLNKTPTPEAVPLLKEAAQLINLGKD